MSYSVGSRANQVQSKEILKEGYYPVVSQGISLVDGYVNEGSKVIKDLPVILFGDHTRNVKYIDFPFLMWYNITNNKKEKALSRKEKSRLFEQFKIGIKSV